MPTANKELTITTTIDKSKLAKMTVGAATKATQDGSGNVITSTYAKAASLKKIIDGTTAVAKATNADAATKATLDSAGNNIANTYVKKKDLESGEVTPGKVTIADKAKALNTAQTISVNLASAKAGSFNGTTSVSAGVSGILQPKNGGTGKSKLDDVTVGSAKKLATAQSFRVNLASEDAIKFDGTQAMPIGVRGVLPQTHGGTGSKRFMYPYNIAGMKDFQVNPTAGDDKEDEDDKDTGTIIDMNKVVKQGLYRVNAPNNEEETPESEYWVNMPKDENAGCTSLLEVFKIQGNPHSDKNPKQDSTMYLQRLTSLNTSKPAIYLRRVTHYYNDTSTKYPDGRIAASNWYKIGATKIDTFPTNPTGES